MGFPPPTQPLGADITGVWKCPQPPVSVSPDMLPLLCSGKPFQGLSVILELKCDYTSAEFR